MKGLDGPTYHLEKVVKRREDEQLQDFSGPLDLILHLLSKNKMEIQDIQITVILDQYLEWMDLRKQMDLEIASEFVTMASHLVYIKSRMLLSVKDEEVLSETERLILSLEEHQRRESYLKIKAVIPQLFEHYAVGQDYLSKGPEDLPESGEVYRQYPVKDLYYALRSLLEKGEPASPSPLTAFGGIVGREPYPVAQKAAEILERLCRYGVIRFQALFQGNQSRSEIVATFISILELCRAHRVHLAGNERDCTITYTEEGEGPLPEFSAEVE